MGLIGLMMFLALVSVAATAQEKTLLQYKAQVGQVVRYRSEGKLAIEAMGQKMNQEQKQTEKVTFTAVSPTGEITMEKEEESSEVTIEGQAVPSDDNKTKETIVIRPNGELVSYKSTAEPEQAKIAARLYAASSVIFSDKPVGVGDKWTHETKANDEIGVRAGKAEYEVLGFEKYNGVDAVKIKMIYQEAEGSPAMNARGTFWVEKSSGDTLKTESEVENLILEFAGVKVTASGKGTGERISGNPLGSAPASSGQATGGQTTPAKPEPKKEKTIDETVKDFEKMEGVFTLYRKRESGRDTIYLELKEEQLNQLMMLQATASTGTSDQVIAGDPINDILFKFVRANEERLYLVLPNINFRAADGKPIKRSVDRAFAESILEAFKIEAKQPERKSLLINVSDLFRGDIAQVSALFRGGGSLPIPGLQRGGNYSLDRDKTSVVAIKLFPDNLFIQSEYNFTSSGGGSAGIGSILGGGGTVPDGRSAAIRVNYNLFPLKENGFRPRLADPRVGYFYTEYEDYTSDNSIERTVRFIYRWNVEKADPSAKLSPPKKPIVFWMDNAIPSEYREAVREGILMWNKAFERIGIKDAIVVKQMPDNADFDHADMRYNVIRWSTTESSPYGAIALFRVNRLTGEIINAGITIDAEATRTTKYGRKVQVSPAAYFDQMDSPRTHACNDPRRCNHALMAAQEAWLGWTALNLLAPVSQTDEKVFVHTFLREMVAHEMGHILGLRHNFIASTLNTPDQLRSSQRLQQTGVTASVMEYAPFNLFALRQKGVPFFSPTIGPYDHFAIEYGYTPLKGKTPQEDQAALQQIASRTNLPGLAWQGDEYADSFDPAVVRFDLGNDPIAYYTRRLQTTRFLLLNLGNRVPKKGESYWEFTRQFNGLLNAYSSSAASVTRYIGGLNMNRNHRGDVRERPTLVPVSSENQRAAMNLLNTYIFAERAFSFPANYFTRMTTEPYGDMLEILTGGAQPDFPIRDTFSNIQRSALRRLFNTAVLRRVANNEFKVGEGNNPFTLAELYQSVGRTVWSDIGGGRSVPALRRALQRSHLDLMIEMVITPPANAPDDARLLAWDQLRQLRSRIGSARRSGGYDTYTRLHLDEALMRINRALDARQMIGAPAPPQPNLLQLLLGGSEQPGQP
jgi:hypothetical protein